jgi:hypothetical protein
MVPYLAAADHSYRAADALRRGAIHFVLFLFCLYFGWFFRAKRRAD